MNIQTNEEVTVTEKLTNTKPWFNGVHTFPSIKVNTPQQPTKLSVSVSEQVVVKDRLA